MIKIIINKIFYSPYKSIKKHINITVDETSILLKSCTFRFDGLKNNNSIKIGTNSMIGCSFIFETDEGEIQIGHDTFINSGTQLISRELIEIGNYVTIAWGCTIYDHNSHSLDYRERQKDIQMQVKDYKSNKHFIDSKDWSVVKSKPIVIEDNVWIGFNCIILSGVKIGEGAIIGAGSVVRENVEPWTVVAGNPAVVIKRLKHV